MKIQLKAYCAYPIFIDQLVEVPDTTEESIETALNSICEEIISSEQTRPLPAIMDGPEFTTV